MNIIPSPPWVFSDVRSSATNDAFRHTANDIEMEITWKCVSKERYKPKRRIKRSVINESMNRKIMIQDVKEIKT